MLKIGITRKVALVAVMALFASAVASSALAETKWEKNHPRRDQVNDRLANQSKRIHKEVKEGEMSKAKAAKLHKEDRQVRKEERIMASGNGGHITKQEQKTLNQQENAISKQIGK
jgi:methionine-rich copper-binding protein CopC